MSKYMKGFNFYAVSNLDDRIANADQVCGFPVITTTHQEFHNMAHLLLSLMLLLLRNSCRTAFVSESTYLSGGRVRRAVPCAPICPVAARFAGDQALPTLKIALLGLLPYHLFSVLRLSPRTSSALQTPWQSYTLTSPSLFWICWCTSAGFLTR